MDVNVVIHSVREISIFQMRMHPDSARAYSVLKLSLAQVFSDDIENYVNGKSSFVQSIDYQTGMARNNQLQAEDSIIIQSYNPAWPKLAEAEISAIKALSDAPYVAIEHIVSSALKPQLNGAGFKAA